jgi:hypothetical protein
MHVIDHAGRAAGEKGECREGRDAANCRERGHGRKLLQRLEGSHGDPLSQCLKAANICPTEYAEFRMTVHLVKLCVGIESIDDLVEWFDSEDCKKARKRKGLKSPNEHAHWTKMKPKRLEEVLDGGSLYWVIRGRICVRHPILRLDDVQDEKGNAYCAIVYEPKVILVETRPRRAFQGWRYLEEEDAPADLSDQRAALRAARAEADLPPKMVAELKALGLL